MGIYFADNKSNEILDIFIKATDSVLDSNGIIHIGKKYGKNKTDKMRPENVIDFYELLNDHTDR